MYLHTFLCFNLSLAFLLHLLCFAFYVLTFVFRKVSFFYCLFIFLLSAFYFCLLCLNFCTLYFGFGFPHAISMIKRHLSTPSNVGSRQIYRETIYSVWIWEGGGNRLIDRCVLHLMSSNSRLYCIRPT